MASCPAEQTWGSTGGSDAVTVGSLTGPTRSGQLARDAAEVCDRPPQAPILLMLENTLANRDRYFVGSSLDRSV